jgi:hypothetical protein
MQGLRRHLLMPKSFATPICHLPAGSGNGVAATCGLWNPVTAVHALIKGAVKPFDAASVFLASETVPRLSILSVQYGLLPDLDLGTEHLRKLLGGERFTYGAVKEILKWRKHKANIAFFKEPAPAVELEGQQSECADVLSDFPTDLHSMHVDSTLSPAFEYCLRSVVCGMHACDAWLNGQYKQMQLALNICRGN